MFGRVLGLFDQAHGWDGFRIVAKPFFKWPGSKSWLINRLTGIWPCDLLRVVEPFAGSAAFYLGSSCRSAFLADTNQQIVSCLSAVRDKPKKVLEYLSRLQNNRDDYARVRDETPANAVSAAGRLIFLTNTSWGGLYRENQRGKFNVPFGNNGRDFFCEETILSASEKLKNVEIRHWGFAQTLEKSEKNDLIFVDAPYVTKTTSEFFDRYHASRFRWGDQLTLAKLLNRRKMASKMMLITCAADPDLYQLFNDWSVFEFSKRNSMTAHTNKTGYRKEALLVSPALSDFSRHLEDRALGICVQRLSY